ncbi:hypothetical protein MVEN_01418500 [Mycena venus]|uniref:Uncharacterized protein n=1 Tax=Mycena venus TaxID=2733690 RepID=A0A8H6XYM9_9AGAR|nr:hypothetical protein MVEN_01418500 [Mycena venus]
MIRLTCRDFIPVYCITCVVFLITTAPALIHRFYPQAAPLAAPCVWLVMTLVHGLAALYFIGALLSFAMLTIDAYKWLTLRLRRACSTPASGPIALEDGTAAPADATSPTGDSDTPAPTPSSAGGMLLRICLFNVLSGFLALCLILMCWIGDIVSLKRPLSENVHNLATFVFEGFPVVLVLFIVLALRVLKRRRQAAAAQELSTPSVDERELGVAAAKETTDV